MFVPKSKSSSFEVEGSGNYNFIGKLGFDGIFICCLFYGGK
jgi:hypothetical protein